MDDQTLEAIRQEVAGRTNLDAAADAFQRAVQANHAAPQAFHLDYIKTEITRRLVADISFAAQDMDPELLTDELAANPDGYFDIAAVATAEHLARLATDGAVIRKPQRLFDTA